MRYTRTDPIAARPGDVWAVLIDIEHWPDWTVSMREITWTASAAGIRSTGYHD